MSDSQSESRHDLEEPPLAEALGKGGQAHRYLQYLINRLAEERGFRATIESDIG